MRKLILSAFLLTITISSGQNYQINNVLLTIDGVNFNIQLLEGSKKEHLIKLYNVLYKDSSFNIETSDPKFRMESKLEDGTFVFIVDNKYKKIIIKNLKVVEK